MGVPIAALDADASPNSGQTSVNSTEKRAFGAISDDSSSDFELANYTEEEERRLVRKVDWALIPGLTLLYLLSFLDRSNVGNAKLFGLLTDIGVKTPVTYNNALALYFVGYVLFEVPANIVLRRLNPKVVLPVMTIAFGITSALQGLIRSKSGFLAARFFLGVSEAGLFPGVVFVFSMYYKRSERHFRVSAFFGGAALAGSFGGILAYGIGEIKTSYRWQWIFYIEGIVTVLVGISAFWWVPAFPRQAKFLSERERAILLTRLARDSDAADREVFQWSQVYDAVKDPLVWGYCALFHGFAFPLYSLSLFLPTIIAQLGYASWKAQLLTVPIYAAAFLAILSGAAGSARTRNRAFWIVGWSALAIVGYIVLLATHTPGSRYAGAFIAVCGVYGGNALVLSWPSENVSGQTKRAVATSAQIFLGDIGAISGVLVYRPNLAHDFYRIPHIVALSYMLFAILVALALYTSMRRKNAERAALLRDVPESELVEKNAPALGDRRVQWVFQL